MRVVVAGAGIGGLALAHGLSRAGAEVVVLERDTDLRRTGGYSLHLRSEALRGLRALLTPEAVERLYAVAQGAWNQHGFAVRDHRARLLLLDPSATGEDVLDIDRVTLRVLLADGLEPHIRMGTEAVGYVERRDHVAVRLADGTEVTGDVVVAADGVGSRIAEKLAGEPTSKPIGMVGVAGRTLAESVPEEVAQLFGNRSTLAIGPRGTGLYVGHLAPLDQSAVHTFTDPPLNADPAYVWGAILIEWSQTASLRDRSGSGLIDATASQLDRRHWATSLVDLIRGADPDTVRSFSFYAAAPFAAGIAPWQASAVTALGDAVHAMPPTGGQGASTAIRDAHLLAGELVASMHGEKTIPIAVHDYHRQMRGYAAAAVAESMQPVRWIRASNRSIGAAVVRAGMPAAAAVSWAVRSARRQDQG